MDDLYQEEIWKPVNGYEGFYEVSSLGRIKRCDSFVFRKNRWGGITKSFHPGKILLPYKNKRNGYMYICLSKQGNVSVLRIHILVAKAFLPNPNNYNHINHIDGDKTNNSMKNLEWCTASYNQKHAYDLGLKIAPKTKIVNQYSMEGEFLKKWHGAKTAEDELKIHNITACCRGVRKSAGGYIWRFEDVR